MERSDRRGTDAEMLGRRLEEPGLDFGLGLELDDCPWEEVDVPHSEEGCTPLITACQKGMTEVVHFLLRKGADVTLCNYRNQTALHVSSPALQGELLWSMFRPLPHHSQLFQASWQGELHSLQHLLTQSDLVDVNSQNRDGLTPLMLAVRDIDMFEGLGARLPWEYRPVEVVRELLAVSADLSVCDHRGCSALHYVSHISSPLKEELLHMMVQALTPTASTALDLHCFHSEEPWAPCHPTSPDPTHRLLLQPTAEDDLKSSGSVLLLEHHKVNSQDKGIPLSFQGAMETLRDLRQAYQDVGKGSSRGASFPSLWTDKNRHWDRMATRDSSLASPGPLRTTGTACLPVPPKPRGRGETVMAPQSSQLSKSAPSLMEPLMDPNSLVQARAHIQTRLVGCSDIERGFKGRKGSLPALLPTCPMPRTPKHLAPLEGRQGDRTALPGLRHPPPLKPISLTPLSSRGRLKRNRLSWTGARGLPLTRGGSEDSSTSSTSSHSSIDLEEEDADDDIHESPLQKPEEIIKERLHFQSDKADSQDRGPLIIQRGISEHIHHREPIKCPSVERQPEQTRTAVNEMRPSLSSDLEAHNDVKDDPRVVAVDLIMETFQNLSKEATSDESPVFMSSTFEILKREKEVQKRDEKSRLSAEDTKNHCPPATVNITLTEKTKPIKPVRNKERRGSTSSQTNQSFNILAHKDHARGIIKSKSNPRTSSVPCIIKAKVRHNPDLVVNREAAINTVKSRVSSTMTGRKSSDTSSSPRKRVMEPSRPGIKRSNLEKKTINNKKVSNQKLPAQRDLKSARQPKKTGTLGTLRAKSAVDYITYSDMFKEIHSGDEGPAIYEMFAGPVYDNLRVSSSCERSRTVQSAPPKKSQIHRIKYKCPKKTLEANRQRKTPVDKLVSTKGKQRVTVSRVKPPLTPTSSTEETVNEVVTSGLDWPTQPSRTDTDLSEDDVGAEELEENHTLSVIEEVLSSFGSKTLTSNCKPHDKMTTSLSEETSDTNRKNSKQTQDSDDESVWELVRGKLTDRDYNDLKGKSRHLDHPVPIPSGSPLQPKINTWTSGSCDRTVSPVFRKFLDEAGEGPLTDDLLRCLAEELISLDERDGSVGPENYDSLRKDFRDGPVQNQEKSFVGEVTSPERVSSSGEVLNDAISWTKGEVLGRGAYGTVYCGLTSHGQLIAVKQVTLDTADSETGDKEYNRLQEEVDLLKTLRHHNIVGYLGTSLREHVVSIFMEYVPGGSIASILHRFGPLPEHVLALYTRQILEGVTFLHQNRVIHRDLKGNNIMLMPTGVVKLIDFGCARRLSCLTHTASRSELLKSVHGTPYWMAPEVINETGHGRKSDIWSVGCTVFEMATGKPPLSHMDKMAALFYIGARRGLMPSLPDGFSQEAKDFVHVCLTSDQTLRPSAEQLLEHTFIPKDEVGIN